MKKIIVILVTGLLLSAALSGCGGKAATGSSTTSQTPKTGSPASQASKTGGTAYEAYLTAADVEQAAGIKGLKAEAAAQTLKFTDSGGKVVYEAKFYEASFYAQEVEANRKYYADVAGVGDKAAVTPSDSPYRLTFVKGKHAVMTQTLSKNTEGKWLLSQEQLISLAKIVASRLAD